MAAALLAAGTPLGGARAAWGRAGGALSRGIAPALAGGAGLAARTQAPLRRRHSLRTWAGSNEGSGGESSEKAQKPGPDEGEKENAAVTAVAGFMGKALYSPFWLVFLFLTLIGFFGGYGYLIVSNIQDSNIPILLGPLRN